jgi:hypothetical protein
MNGESGRLLPVGELLLMNAWTFCCGRRGQRRQKSMQRPFRSQSP